jgi:protein-S-isoprenylcysteine O-methyltransferase Ste14
MESKLYQYRGWILGLFAVLLLVLPPTTSFFSLSAILLIFSGILIRIEARRSIGEHSRGHSLSADALVKSGIYAYLRHPLYLSNIMIGCGFILIHLSWTSTSFILATALILFFYNLSVQEDRFLLNQFGESWLAWKDKTNAFLPKKPDTKPIQSNKRSIQKAFFADRSTWGWLLFFSLLLILRRYIGDMI